MTLEIFNELKTEAQKQRSEPITNRIGRLKKIQNWVLKNENKIIEAAARDFGKPPFEAVATEIFTVRSELHHNIKCLKKWAKPLRRKTPLTLLGHRSWVCFENKGVVLIIAPWNYPFLLVLSPLISALAAGNTVVVKPSELTPNMAKVIQQFISDCFLPNEVFCELGDKAVTQKLLEFSFNHVFFTGSTQVGRSIAESCAKKLIPVTLELGGKSPVIIDQTADLKDAAQKIHWAKFLNRGQTCVAPDYIYIHAAMKDAFVKLYNQTEAETKSEQPTRIVNAHHQERIKKLSNNQWDETKNTLLIEIKNWDHPMMQEEIFGPIVPLLTYETESDLLQNLKFDQRPLTMMFFSEDQNFIDRVTKHFPSGSVTINTTTLQVGNSHLPFGGIGPSGTGTSHGYEGFKEFSHQRSYMKHSFFKSMYKVLRPPYSDFQFKLLRRMMKLTT